VARLLREERMRRGLSMNSVAKKSGLSQQMVSYVERGLRNPTLDTLLRITNALKIDLSKLIKRASKASDAKR
jgi:transcriptional regulator with XRE-family HTH domain